MKTTFRLAALAAATLIALPSLADTMAPDPSKLSCKDLMAMDMAGMMSVGMAVKEAMKDDAMIAALSDDEVMKMAEEHCKGHDDSMVLDAVKM
jgi:hypothetical protein